MSDDLKNAQAVGGKYELGDVVGSGGMGKVHEATEIVTGKKVALKLLHRWHEHDDHQVARFQREAKLASGLGHENICEVIDNGITEDGTPYLVMPLLSGMSFGDLLKKGPVSLERIVNVLSQTLAGLQAAHTAQIVHRDLKPDNIFVISGEDGVDRIKILDFGVSKYFGDDFNEVLTRTGTIPGTPAYMSPEQATGSKNLDARIDLYATGVVLYEALTGRRPFEGDSYNEILFNIISKPFDAPRVINPDVPTSIEKVILKAMERNPQRRFPNAREMNTALLAALEGHDLVEEFPTVTQEYIKEEDVDSLGDTQLAMAQPSFFKRNKRLVFLASTGALTLAAAIGIWMSGVLGPDSTSGESDEDTRVESQNSEEQRKAEAKKQPAEPSSEEPIDEVDTATSDEPAADSKAEPPAKENGKNGRRGTKKKPVPPHSGQTGGDEDKKDNEGSEKDPVEGRFGTVFESNYGDD